VSTPIGNLRDITLRAIDVLQQVELVASEDTRKSRVLLDCYGIKTHMTSYYDYNKEKVTPGLVKQLLSSKSIALITDAGTPGISDPAFYLVREAIKNNINIEAIPGPTALVPALIISGLPTDKFVFEGFLPTKKGRHTRLELLKTETRTIILYESPKRILRTLQDLFAAFGERDVVVAREMTKKFEQVIRGKLGEITSDQNMFITKGEFVIVVHGLGKKIKREKYKNKVNE
jgi:16S rRNA (cytidine1402-2'-O)-methyltransferase